MGKCLSCGRKGLFLKVNTQGLCNRCSKINTTSIPVKAINKLSSQNLDNKKVSFYNIKHKQIPQEIFELLWFLDGEYKNCNIQNEPSAISISLPIKSGDISELGYYPSYFNMNPFQRYQYLEWLSDINQSIDIGYVFTFYYGLERHIYNGNYERVLPILLQLKEIHNNDSFQFYTNSALALIALKTRKVEYLKYFDMDTLTDNAFLALKVSFNHYLTPSDIIKIRKLVNFTNTRYIKLEPDLFESILAQQIKEIFNSENYMIEITNKESLGTVGAFLIGNISLNEREIQVVDVISDEKIFKDLHSLLINTHEEVKKYLKEARKVNKLSK